jgi:hypothetical protein
MMTANLDPPATCEDCGEDCGHIARGYCIEDEIADRDHMVAVFCMPMDIELQRKLDR